MALDHLEEHLDHVIQALSAELDRIAPWDEENERRRKVAKAVAQARLENVALPHAGFVWAQAKEQRVRAHVTLKLITDNMTDTVADPRAGAFRALALDLAVSQVPPDTEVARELAVGLGVSRSFPHDVATATVSEWAATSLVLLRTLAVPALDAFARHNSAADAMVQDHLAAMKRCEELSAELREIVFS
jgi:hypothetical protein